MSSRLKYIALPSADSSVNHSRAKARPQSTSSSLYKAKTSGSSRVPPLDLNRASKVPTLNTRAVFEKKKKQLISRETHNDEYAWETYRNSEILRSQRVHSLQFPYWFQGNTLGEDTFSKDHRRELTLNVQIDDRIYNEWFRQQERNRVELSNLLLK